MQRDQLETESLVPGGSRSQSYHSDPSLGKPYTPVQLLVLSLEGSGSLHANT